MGDCVITTNNRILLENVIKLPTVQCIQYKASKKIPNEDDIVESNILGFGNAVGSITNKATSMYEVQARFSKGSKEYETLAYRIKCSQAQQQAEIDKIKGIVAKKPPKYWYDFFATKPSDDDDEETIEWKNFQRSIVADRKPYFFRYVYSTENTRWLKYIKDCNTKSVMLFGIEVDELEALESHNEEQQLFLDNYYAHLPLGIAPCTVNRIAWRIEDIFKNQKLKPVEKFDYNLMKNDEVVCNEESFQKIKTLYKDFLKDRHDLDALYRTQNLDNDTYTYYCRELKDRFLRLCSLTCPNKLELCNILIDVCYRDSISSKRFVWEMCGDSIIENLLKRNGGNVSYPVQDKNGDFSFNGIRFSMQFKNFHDMI